MGKAEVGSIKHLANKMKAKGLQKLRWYCQMCQKQCRDENGFKCHTSSESHQRQLLLFADNIDQYLDQFSQDFEDGYLELLRRQFGTKRVSANKVYQDYINDREHVHMNSTQWETLTEFVKHLGKSGKCIADETEKGWFVTYIDRDPETIAFQEKMAKKEKAELDDAERNAKFLEHQIELGKQKEAMKQQQLGLEPVSHELIRNENDEKLKLKIDTNIFKKLPSSSTTTKNVQLNKLDIIKHKPSSSSSSSSSYSSSSKKSDKDGSKRKLTALEEIKLEEEKAKKKRIEKEINDSKVENNWLNKNIVVKIITKSLGDKFYKKKGVIDKVIDKYCGVVSLLESKHKIKLDQQHLETVIPNIGKPVLILSGRYKGEIALLKNINIDDCNADVELVDNEFNGRIIKNIDYSNICKIITS